MDKSPAVYEMIKDYFRIVALPLTFVANDIFLFNFAVDSAALRPQHISGLDHYFGADEDPGSELALQAFHTTVDPDKVDFDITIIGETSRSGTTSHNEELSYRRAQSARLYLLSPLAVRSGGSFPTKIRPSKMRIRMVAQGAALASSRTEAAGDRATVIRIQCIAGIPPPPLPPLAANPEWGLIARPPARHPLGFP